MSVVALLIFFDFAMLYLILEAIIGWPLWGAVIAGLVGVLVAWAGFSLAMKYGIQR